MPTDELRVFNSLVSYNEYGLVHSIQKRGISPVGGFMTVAEIRASCEYNIVHWMSQAVSAIRRGLVCGHAEYVRLPPFPGCVDEMLWSSRRLHRGLERQALRFARREFPGTEWTVSCRVQPTFECIVISLASAVQQEELYRICIDRPLSLSSGAHTSYAFRALPARGPAGSSEQEGSKAPFPPACTPTVDDVPSLSSTMLDGHRAQVSRCRPLLEQLNASL